MVELLMRFPNGVPIRIYSSLNIVNQTRWIDGWRKKEQKGKQQMDKASPKQGVVVYVLKGYT
jgi:hypothetical protein